MTETFVAELVVATRTADYEDQLAAPARAWFGGPVRLVSVEISLSPVDGLPGYVMRGRFHAAIAASPSRLQTAARWLGLVADGPTSRMDVRRRRSNSAHQ